jgi:hypothetical protein
MGYEGTVLVSSSGQGVEVGYSCSGVGVCSGYLGASLVTS